MQIDRIDLINTLRIRRTGLWRLDPTTRYAGSMYYRTDENNSQLIFSILASKIVVHAFKGPNQGSFDVEIDGQNIGTFSLEDNDATELYEALIPIISNLTSELHIVKFITNSNPIIIDSIYGILE